MTTKLKLNPINEWLFYKQRPLLIAGPCSAENQEQMMRTARELIMTNKVDIFRAGIWKPRTRPGSFEGIGKEGLIWLRDIKREFGLPISTEVANASHVNDALKFGVDVLWIGARTSANPFAIQEIADALQGVETTVLIKNPVNPDLELWVGAIERIYKTGIKNIGAIHRGFSAFEKTLYRNQPKWQLPIELKTLLPEIPLICDPSHIGGSREFIAEISQKAMDLNYDGLMIETHCDPDCALSDKNQQLTPQGFNSVVSNLILRKPSSDNSQFMNILGDLRSQIDLYDDQLLDILEQRMKVAEQIGKVKKDNNITILQTSRWEEIIKGAITKGKAKGLSEEFVDQLFKAVHQESINHQNIIMNEPKQ